VLRVPTDILVHILQFLDILTLVLGVDRTCTAWRTALKSGAALTELEMDAPELANADPMELARRFPRLRHLVFQEFTADYFGVLRVCRNLNSLRFQSWNVHEFHMREEFALCRDLDEFQMADDCTPSGWRMKHLDRPYLYTLPCIQSPAHLLRALAPPDVLRVLHVGSLTRVLNASMLEALGELQHLEEFSFQWIDPETQRTPDVHAPQVVHELFHGWPTLRLLRGHTPHEVEKGDRDFHVRRSLDRFLDATHAFIGRCLLAVPAQQLGLHVYPKELLPPPSATFGSTPHLREGVVEFHTFEDGDDLPAVGVKFDTLKLVLPSLSVSTSGTGLSPLLQAMKLAYRVEVCCVDDAVTGFDLFALACKCQESEWTAADVPRGGLHITSCYTDAKPYTFEQQIQQVGGIQMLKNALHDHEVPFSFECVFHKRWHAYDECCGDLRNLGHIPCKVLDEEVKKDLWWTSRFI